MPTALTIKGQVTIPKRVRDALQLTPGDAVEFAVNREGQVIVHKAGRKAAGRNHRFESFRGRANIRWRTDELMALLRETD